MGDDTTRGRVLLTGATGFVGRHVYPALKAAGYDVVCSSRDPARARSEAPDRTWVRLDVEDPGSFEAVAGCRYVVYLVHQMGGGQGYPAREATAARALRDAATAAGVERIVYLGGVAPTGAASPHLSSRLQTGALLREGSVPAIELRAGMIIGADGASWQIVRDLAARLPAMLLPRWLNNRSSPVAIDDVVVAVLWALDQAPARSAWYDLPGPEVVSHRVLMARVAAVMGKRPAMMEVPVVTPLLSSYWIALVTRIGLPMARELVQGLQSDLVPSGASVWDHVAHHRPTSLEQAVRHALSDESSTQQPAASALERLRAIGAACRTGAAP